MKEKMLGGLLGVVTLLFIALRLAGVIVWSWLWVLSPLWLAALALGLLIHGILLWAYWVLKHE